MLTYSVFLVALFSTQADHSARESFSAYRTALLADDGTAAAQQVTEGTFDYFEEMTRVAVCGSAEEVVALEVINRMQVILFRHRVPLDQLVSMSGRDMFVYAVDHGWVGKGGMTSTELGEISQSGDHATATLLVNGEPAPGATFDFKKEQGSWKLDVVSALASGNAVLEQMARQQGVGENMLITALVTRVSGSAPRRGIFEPVAPDHPRCAEHQ